MSTDLGQDARLFSYWELMEELGLGELIKAHHTLLIIGVAHSGDQKPLPLGLRMEIHNCLSVLDNECRRLGLIVPVQYVENARKLLADQNVGMKLSLLSRHLNMVVDAIEIELRGRLTFAINVRHTDFYTGRKLFDAKVFSDFPSASFDFDEAGKSFALGRYTACVFHLMRVLEIGIKAVKECLAIPDPSRGADRNWGALLRKFKEEMDRRSANKLWSVNGDKDVFEEIYASLDAIRNPWRNATMHVKNTYTEEEAEHIAVVVRGFMVKLASRMDQEGNPKA